MRSFRELTRAATLRPFAAVGTLGVCLIAAACGDEFERVSTTNALSDAGLDASADAEVDVTSEDASVSTGELGSVSAEASVGTTTREAQDAGDTEPPATTTPETTETPLTSETTATSSAPEESTTSPASETSTGQSSEPPLPATCGNDELDGNEMCCRASDVEAALAARFAAAELLLNGDLGCAPPQASEANNVTYEMCQGACGTDVGCALSASNVELTFNPDTMTFSGIADVVIEGSVALTLSALNQSVSCDMAHVLFEEVTFSGDLATEVGQEQAVVDVRGVDTELGIPTVTDCDQGNVISAAFVLMQAPIQTAVAEAVEQALEGSVAQAVQCPY